jgi:hypothetical protein
LFAAVAAAGNLAFAQGWGNLTATFVVKGTVPKPAKLDVAKEPFCVKHADVLVDESLVVGPNGELKNVVVSLVSKDKVKVHESFAASEKGEVVLDNQKCRFEPRIAVLRTSQTLVVSNSDSVGHNSKIDLFANPGVNPLIPPMGKVPLNFKMAESRPMPVSCNIHPWMGGFLVIKDDPYAAVSDAKGTLTISNIPAGKWSFHVWHERPANITAPTVQGKPATWAKGRVDVEIKDGQTIDLGGGKPIELSADQVKKK